LIRAAAAKSGVDPIRLAQEELAEDPASTAKIAERLQAVEHGMTALASEVRRALVQSRGAGRSSASPPKKSQAAPEA
jgi:LPS sulfotransferase NodH